MRSKCLTLKAKGCSRPISEWDLWGWTWVLPASPSPGPPGANTALLSLQRQGDADHAGGEIFQGGGNRALWVLSALQLPSRGCVVLFSKTLLTPRWERTCCCLRALTEFRSLSHLVRPE